MKIMNIWKISKVQQQYCSSYDIQTLVGSLCSSSASLVCCPGLDPLGSLHLHHPKIQEKHPSVKKQLPIQFTDWCSGITKSIPLSFLLFVSWCRGGVCRNASARSMVGSAVCRGKWVCAAAAASPPRGRSLPPLSSPGALPLGRSDSSPGSREVGPSCVGTACNGSCQLHTYYPAQERHPGR